MEQSLQDRFAPKHMCFGCGPANEQGLRIKSRAGATWEKDGEVVADWSAAPHHEAFPGMLNGGIVGALLDCHSNWAAAIHLMRQSGSETLPSTVTAEFHVKLLRVTPSSGPLTLRAKVVESQGSKATVEAEVVAGGKTTATCRGVFVEVREGHPAYHRWGA